IFQQGQENSSLYFINGGKLNILYRQGDRELFIKKMGTGDIAGDDTFFTASLCTTTLVAISNVKIKFLDRSVLKQWQKDLPALESKIHDFCLRSETASDLLQKKSINRRRQQRVPITGTILIQLVNAAGQALGKVLMGDLSDISVGGVSFLIKARQKETARLLLGKKMNVKISHSTHEINENGTVIGVRYNPQEFRQDTDYSVHMKFDKPLDSQTIWEIENTRRKS
ncbi:MAG: cyclic nucleotide-binding domain-containing protein, partial [Proteobacteria bacterium]|nr:cyclic nucleotide-binding domain-containing protein [Pseudomonadota bacterium]